METQLLLFYFNFFKFADILVADWVRTLLVLAMKQVVSRVLRSRPVVSKTSGHLCGFVLLQLSAHRIADSCSTDSLISSCCSSLLLFKGNSAASTWNEARLESNEVLLIKCRPMSGVIKAHLCVAYLRHKVSRMPQTGYLVKRRRRHSRVNTEDNDVITPSARAHCSVKWARAWNDNGGVERLCLCCVTSESSAWSWLIESHLASSCTLELWRGTALVSMEPVGFIGVITGRCCVESARDIFFSFTVKALQTFGIQMPLQEK